jgi:hypothetical protein
MSRTGDAFNQKIATRPQSRQEQTRSTSLSFFCPSISLLVGRNNSNEIRQLKEEEKLLSRFEKKGKASV